jgi:hypothetical protein
MDPKQFNKLLMLYLGELQNLSLQYVVSEHTINIYPTKTSILSNGFIFLSINHSLCPISFIF